MKVSYVKSADAPKGALHLSIGNQEYDLSDKGSLDAEDPQVQAAFDLNPFLKRSGDNSADLQAEIDKEAAADIARFQRDEEARQKAMEDEERAAQEQAEAAAKLAEERQAAAVQAEKDRLEAEAASDAAEIDAGVVEPVVADAKTDAKADQVAKDAAASDGGSK